MRWVLPDLPQSLQRDERGLEQDHPRGDGRQEQGAPVPDAGPLRLIPVALLLARQDGGDPQQVWRGPRERAEGEAGGVEVHTRELVQAGHLLLQLRQAHDRGVRYRNQALDESSLPGSGEPAAQ